MHRSGTSFVASCLGRLGFHVGDDLLPPDQGNPRGYFEDREFLDLNRRILHAATHDEPGHRDWGWTVSGFFDQAGADAFLPEARALVERREAEGRPWAFKDPRTTLLLDLWQRALQPVGGGRFIFLYRFPWEVLQSIVRVGPVGGLHRPDWLLPIWCRYNRALLDFRRRHRGDVLLVSTHAAVTDPEAFLRLVVDRFEIEPAGESVGSRAEFDPTLFRQGQPQNQTLAELMPAAWPELAELLAELDTEADLSSAGAWRVTPNVAPRLQPASAPDVSIVVPCRDHGQYLIEAVASVVDIADGGRVEPELIIVDDGSAEPDTLRILELLRSRGFSVLSLPPSGLARARNHGLGLARGRYLLPLDADNRIRAAYVERAVGLLDAKPEVAIAYGDVQEFGERCARVEVQTFDLNRLLQSNFLDACAVYRREVWQATGGYDPEVPTWSDWDFWLAAAARGFTFEHLPEIAQDYRVREDSMLCRALDAGEWRGVAQQVVEKHRGFYAEHVERVVAGFLASQEAISQDAARLRQARDRSDLEATRMWPEIQRLSHEIDRLQRLYGLAQDELRSLRHAGESLRLQRDALAAEAARMSGSATWRWRSRLLSLPGLAALYRRLRGLRTTGSDHAR
jgi:hypothetical protein